MERLIIVSNRLRVTVVKREKNIRFNPSVGGLATGLSSLYKTYHSTWVGWPGIAVERIREEKNKIKRKLTHENCFPIFLNQHDIELYYRGFCNRTIWPLFHYFTQYATYNKNQWESYIKVNKLFCNEIIKIARPNDKVWVHDYHLMILPKFLRAKMPDLTIGFFLHIPFPSSEVFRLIPSRNEIIEGLLGADLIGFHTYDYAYHFIETVRRLIGYEHALGQINTGTRLIKVDAFPMGIDYDQFANATSNHDIQKEINKIIKKVGERKIIVSIDRLDYTKGIPQRLEAFDYFLENNSEYREKVTLILVAVPSRTAVEQYAALKREVDELISRINGKYGTIGWMPIWYLYRFLPFKNLVPLYSVADVALITPIRDGMNLIAKEFIATRTAKKGVLILSEMAGASKELGEAIIVNPNNKEEIGAAIKKALTMSNEEQVRRNEIMLNQVRRYNVVKWAHDFMDRLSNIKNIQREMYTKNLKPSIKEGLIKEYSKSKCRLLLLDYDGTLVAFSGKPEQAKPDEKILNILKRLTHDKNNEVVIISGRGKDTLERWFKDVHLGLIAEHGVWTKEKTGSWQIIEPLRNDWKAQIKPIFEFYAERTPGALIEEKNFSLAWHYRKVDPRLAGLRAGELKEALLHITENLNLGILEGSKVIEVKNVGINKGHAAQKWLGRERWDFVIAVGDDWTDEDTFAVLPDWGYSIKIGFGFSRARFCVESSKVIRELLKQFGDLSCAEK